MKTRILILLFIFSVFLSCKKESSSTATDIKITGRWVTEFVYREGDNNSVEELSYEYVYDFNHPETLTVEKYRDGKIQSLVKAPYWISGNILRTEEKAFDNYLIFIRPETQVKINILSDKIIEFERDYYYTNSGNEYKGQEYLRLKKE